MTPSTQESKALAVKNQEAGMSRGRAAWQFDLPAILQSGRVARAVTQASKIGML
jgi:hypothetical protein